MFWGKVPDPLIVGVELLVVVAAAAGAELVELGAAAEALVATELEEVVGPAPAEPAPDAQVQIAFAAARTETAVAWQLESTQPWAAELIAAYWELEHWQAKSVMAQPTRETAELMQGTWRGSIEFKKDGQRTYTTGWNCSSQRVTGSLCLSQSSKAGNND